MGKSIIGALAARLDLNASGFEKGAQTVRREAGSLKSTLAGGAAWFGPLAVGVGVGTAALGAFTEGLRRAAEAAQYADDLATAAYLAGETAEALQELRHAGEAVDIPVEKLDVGLRNLNSTLGALRTHVGDGRIRKAFDELGIDPKVLDRMNSAADLLPVLADRFVTLGNHADAVQLAKKLQIEDLLPLLLRGAEGIAKLRQAARDLGLVLDESTVQGVAAMNEELRIADERSATAGRRMGSELVPILVQIKNAAADAKSAIADMFQWAFRAHTLDGQIRLALTNAQKARQNADTIRNGTPGEAMLAGATVFDLLGGKAGREAKARLAEAEAARLDRLVETLSNKARAAVDAPAVEPPATAFSSRASDKDKDKKGGAPRAFPFLEADPSTRRDTMEIDKRTFAEERFAEQLEEATRNGVAKGATEGLKAERERISELWRYTIQGGVSSFVYGGAKGLMHYLADMFRQRLVERLTDGILNLFETRGQGGGVLGGILNVGKQVLGFAGGGTGKVGGVGGIDSQLVSMRLTPGELVDVRRPGAAGGPTVTQIFHVHAEGAVLASSLMDEMREIGVQAAAIGEVRGAARAEQRIMRRGRQRLR